MATSEARELMELFVTHAPEVSAGDPDALGAQLVAVLKEATEAWPGVEVEPSGFVPDLARRLPPGALASAELNQLNTRGLFLAWACLQGDRGALVAFERECMPGVRAALAQMEQDGSLTEDVEQMLRDKLLVGDRETPGKLAEYRGRGELRAWVRVAAVRHGLNWRRKLHREQAPGDDVLAQVAAPDDPELAYLKGHYQQEFKAAFHAALAELDRSERNLLRSRLLDALSIDELALLYGIHRSTAARRLEQVRNTLQAKTRAILQKRLAISPLEFASIARLVMSRFDASIRRVLSESDD